MSLGDLVRISGEAAQFAREKYENETGIIVQVEENVYGSWSTVLWPDLKPISMPDGWLKKLT